MKDGTVPADTGALLGLKVPLSFLKVSRVLMQFCSRVVALQVVGGKMTESGRLCAFITKVKRGSLADTVGHLRPGTLTSVECLLHLVEFSYLLSLLILKKKKIKNLFHNMKL